MYESTIRSLRREVRELESVVRDLLSAQQASPHPVGGSNLSPSRPPFGGFQVAFPPNLLQATTSPESPSRKPFLFRNEPTLSVSNLVVSERVGVGERGGRERGSPPLPSALLTTPMLYSHHSPSLRLFISLLLPLFNSTSGIPCGATNSASTPFTSLTRSRPAGRFSSRSQAQTS